MPRPKKKRKVNCPPKMLGFKPFGIRFCDTEHIVMQYEEYEAVKLVVYDSFSQGIAAEKMEVSRPTLTRIYNSALKKIAQAFVEGKSILIKGGNFEFEKDWYKCNNCFRLIGDITNSKVCGDCSSDETTELLNLKE
ncbi:DUF134 domain-containing protein [Polaribacter sp. L3A8]|uniref:DUF134 domain-containing protein n=1 Tax=Polaribacter sp. L3A8 TaxID=2686361 RepID=UPI00131DA17E|nr:DUF134 domain-containing protein [Polaribacter sp. L3A8]